MTKLERIKKKIAKEYMAARYAGSYTVWENYNNMLKRFAKELNLKSIKTLEDCALGYADDEDLY